MSQPQQRSPLPSQGWYADPSQAGMNRYWDGQRWSDQTAPAPTAPQVPAGPGASVHPPGTFLPPTRAYADKLALWGYITAIVFPIVGLYLGFKLRGMDDKRGNTVLIIVAVVVVLIAISTLADSSSAAAVAESG